MATFAILKSRVSKRVGLNETAAGQDDVLLGYYLNDAVRDFLMKTRINVNRAEIAITEETDDAELPVSAMAINELYVLGSDGGIGAPTRTTPAEIIRYRRAASAPSGSPTITYYALQGNDMLMFYPALSTEHTFVIYYVPVPTEMSSAAHDPSTETYGGIPVQFHPALEMYAAFQMADIDDDQSTEMGQTYQKQYDRLVKECQKLIRRKGGRSLGPIVVGRRLPVRQSRSADW